LAVEEPEARLVDSTQPMGKTVHLEPPLPEAEELVLAAVGTPDSLRLVGVVAPVEARPRKAVTIMVGRGRGHRAVRRSIKTLPVGGTSTAIAVGISGDMILRLAPVVVEPALPVVMS
jgi:hypothetical protein